MGERRRGGDETREGEGNSGRRGLAKNVREYIALRASASHGRGTRSRIATKGFRSSPRLVETRFNKH
jgi:hypothetical protein